MTPQYWQLPDENSKRQFFLLHRHLIGLSDLPFCSTASTQVCKEKTRKTEQVMNEICQTSSWIVFVWCAKGEHVLLFAKLADVGPGEKGKPFGSTTEAKLQLKKDREKKTQSCKHSISLTKMWFVGTLKKAVYSFLHGEVKSPTHSLDVSHCAPNKEDVSQKKLPFPSS